MLFGREKELEELGTIYDRGGFRAICLYGKRKVGKTTILQEFAKGKRVVYFSALESSGKQNLIQLSAAIYKEAPVSADSAKLFRKYDEAFRYMRDTFGKERIVFIIDDIQNLLSSDKDFALLFKKAIDNVFRSTNIMLIISGSPEKIMLDAINGEKSPLFKKFSAQIHVEAFNYMWTAMMLPNFSPEEKAIIYGMTGGVPGYISRIDANKSLKENIIDLFLKNDAYLQAEPDTIIRSVIREPAYYNAIIEEIADGAGSVNDISEATDLDTATTSTYMKPLLNMGIVKKHTALTEENNRKKTLYKVEDYVIAFAHKMDMNNKYLRGTVDFETIYDVAIAPALDYYMQDVFHDMCLQYLEEKNRQRELHFKFERIGRWWGKDKKTGKALELPLFALNDSDEKALYGKFKYNSDKMNIEDVFDLMETAKKMKEYDNKFYIVFSKNGFTEDVAEIIDSYKNFKRVTLEDMYSFF